MATAVKKTISLPPDLAGEAEDIAKEEGKTLSAVIQDALRLAKKARLKKEFFCDAGLLEQKGKGEGCSDRSRSKANPQKVTKK